MTEPSKPWWRYLLEGLMSAWSSAQLRQAGAGPDAMKLSGTLQLDLPALGEPVAAAEARARAAIVAFMRAQLGKHYQLGVEVAPGREEDALAWDCSEAVEAAYRLAGYPLPDGSPMQYSATMPVPRPLAGDLFFLWSDKWGRIGHVMVATGEGTVVHAVGGRGVVEDPVSMWERHPRGRGWRRHVDFARPREDRTA